MRDRHAVGRFDALPRYRQSLHHEAEIGKETSRPADHDVAGVHVLKHAQGVTLATGVTDELQPERLALNSDQLDADVLELSLDLVEFTDDVDSLDDEFVFDSLDEELVLDSLDVETIDDVDEAVRDSTDVDRSDAFEFLVMWPDGSEEPATEASAYVEDAGSITDELVVTEFDDGNLEFSMPPLELSD